MKSQLLEGKSDEGKTEVQAIVEIDQRSCDQRENSEIIQSLNDAEVQILTAIPSSPEDNNNVLNLSNDHSSLPEGNCSSKSPNSNKVITRSV